MSSVQEVMNAIEAQANYVHHSLIVKDYDWRGATLKWLEYINPPTNTIGTRKEKFLCTAEADKLKEVLQREVEAETFLDEAH